MTKTLNPIIEKYYLDSGYELDSYCKGNCCGGNGIFYKYKGGSMLIAIDASIFDNTDDKLYYFNFLDNQFISEDQFISEEKMLKAIKLIPFK